MNRVVITGYGVVSPIGNTQAAFVESLQQGKNGIGPITKFDAQDTGIHVAAEVRDFPLTRHLTKRDQKRMDTFSLYGVDAALSAIEHAKLDVETIDRDRLGVIVGSGIGGLPVIEEQAIRMHEKGAQRVSPMFVPMSIVNMVAGNIALNIGAQGVCTTTVTACASATHAIGEAFRQLKHGYADVMVTGGAEASICELGIAGFAALNALSTSADADHASLPFDQNRGGFVMGEGAGMLILETLEHAQQRQANILAEVVGYGATSDAYHMTAPTPNGEGAGKAMQLAIAEAEIDASAVDYINAHGTGTQANDLAESHAIHYALGTHGNDVYVSSTKSMTGHLLGAAGAIEAIATAVALAEQFVPPTINCQNVDENIALNVVTTPQQAELTYGLSSSLGFGGHNGSLLLKRWEK